MRCSWTRRDYEENEKNKKFNGGGKNEKKKKRKIKTKKLLRFLLLLSSIAYHTLTGEHNEPRALCQAKSFRNKRTVKIQLVNNWHHGKLDERYDYYY